MKLTTTIMYLAFPLFAFACFAVSSSLAVVPAPDGGYLNFNTAEGEDALFSLSSGERNTAIGRRFPSLVLRLFRTRQSQNQCSGVKQRKGP